MSATSNPSGSSTCRITTTRRKPASSRTSPSRPTVNGLSSAEISTRTPAPAVARRRTSTPSKSKNTKRKFKAMRRLLLLPLLGLTARAADEPRTHWIAPDTGHRVIRLSTEPGSSTLYFHDNSYSPQGDKYLMSTPSGIAILDLTKLGTEAPKADLVVPGGRGGYMARRTREIYFVKGGGGGGGGGGRGQRGGQPPSAQAQRDGSTPAAPATPAAAPSATP